MEICRIATSSTEYLSFPKPSLNLLKDLLKLKGNLCSMGLSTYLSDSETATKSSSWKLLANSSTAVIRKSSTEVRKNNADFYQQRIQIAHLGRAHLLGSWHHCNRLVTSTKTTLRPEIVLFVVHLMCERKGSLGVHESQMPIVVSSPSEPLRCHECQRKKISPTHLLWEVLCRWKGKEEGRGMECVWVS